jgi:hypothetical protein
VIFEGKGYLENIKEQFFEGERKEESKDVEV